MMRTALVAFLLFASSLTSAVDWQAVGEVDVKDSHPGASALQALRARSSNVEEMQMKGFIGGFVGGTVVGVMAGALIVYVLVATYHPAPAHNIPSTCAVTVEEINAELARRGVK
jgi:hypothetical protein